MKNITQPILTLIAVLILSIPVYAQLGVGASAGNSQVGIHLRYAFDLNENWDLIPQFTLFSKDNVTFQLGANFSRNFRIGDNFQFYPLGGLRLITGQAPVRHVMGREIGGYGFVDVELVFGGGAKYEFSNKLTLFGELQAATNGDGIFNFGTYIHF